jgi:hypothetical protein
VEGQLIAVPDSAFDRQRIWTFEESADASKMKLVHELLLRDAAGGALFGYDPEGIAANPEGGYIIATEGAAGNGGSTASACTTRAGSTEKQRNRLLFVRPDGSLDAAYGGGDGVVDLPCAATGDVNGMDWSKLTGDGFEGVAVIDGRPGTSGGLKVYTAIQRPLAGNVDPAGLTRLGEYDADTGTWNFYHYPLDPDLTGARSSIVVSEIAHLGGGEFAVLERDQRRAGAATVKRIYRVRLSSGTPNRASDPLEKTLAMDLLKAPFRFDFEKIETIALTPRGAFLVNDNDGGEEAVLFYRTILAPTPGQAGESADAGSDAGRADGGVPEAGVAPESGVKDAAVSEASSRDAGPRAQLVINEISSNPNPDWIEFFNPGPGTVELTGWSITDNQSGAGHSYAFPRDLRVLPGAYLVLDQETHFPFGLGGADALILYDSTGAIADQISWKSHAATMGRCPDGTGVFAMMSETKNRANDCR